MGGSSLIIKFMEPSPWVSSASIKERHGVARDCLNQQPKTKLCNLCYLVRALDFSVLRSLAYQRDSGSVQTPTQSLNAYRLQRRSK